VSHIDGQVGNFLTWYFRFGNYAHHHGFKWAVSAEIDDMMPAGEDSPRNPNAATAAAEVAALAKNKAAHAHSANCMTASRDMGYVRGGISEAWPNGLTSAVIKCMFVLDKLDNAMALAKCQARLMRLKIGAKANPLDLFVKIAEIKAQYKSATYTIDHHLIVSTMLHAAPLHYKLVISAVQVAQGNAMTIDNLEDAMDLYHCILNNKGKGANHNEEGKAVLSGFTRACHTCGEVGHTKANCPKKQAGKSPRNNRNKTPWRKCKVCSKKHAGPCWEDKANAHLCLANWKFAKAGNNIAAAVVATSADKGELLLSGMANMNWSKALMPKGMMQDMDTVKDSVEKVITDDVKNVITDDNDMHWFLFEWFLPRR
jgi:hypothetical protein